MKIYQLSEYGRQVTWTTWVSLGGCGLPNWASYAWSRDATLGDIEDNSMAAGRCLARYAVEKMNMPMFSEERTWADIGEPK